VPTVVGFLLTGMAIGPNGLALIDRPDSVSSLAEVGVVLLLFAIGLELSLSRIVRMGRWVLLGGGAQVVLTAAVVAIVLHFVRGVGPNLAIFAGALVALSSTAIILKLFTDRGELDTVQGRVVVAVLLFQDLCVVPLMLLVPFLAGTGGGAGEAVRQIIASIVVVGILVLGGRIVVPRVLHRIAELRNREIFTLSVVCIGLGAAYVTSLFGLSLALGAFIAGLIIAESEYGLQALSDVLPFRDTFTGIFFTSVGMLLDLGAMMRNPLPVFGGALGILVLKTLVVVVVVRFLRRKLHVGILSGLALAQVGEFSFVLAGAALSLGLLAPVQYQMVLGASVVTMLAAPFLVAAGPAISERIVNMLGHTVRIPTEEQASVAAMEDHTIIIGYGLNGQNLARALEGAHIPYVILEQNGQVVRRARLDREPIFFGDGTRADVLEHVGIHRARVLVFAIAAVEEERRGVAVARQLNPELRIIVRTRYVREIEELRRLGADEVVPEEFETSIEIFSRVLERYGVPETRIYRAAVEARADQYGILRSERRGAAASVHPALASLGANVRIETVEVDASSAVAGETLGSLRLRTVTGATVLAVIRDKTATYAPDPSFQFAGGDEVVLMGAADSVDRARDMFVEARS
jgi:monovalent cation:H+ antiporter-2, CPA2 family